MLCLFLFWVCVMCVYVILVGECFFSRSLLVNRVKDVFCQKNDEKNRSKVYIHTINAFGAVAAHR